jgi:hypothetical protein
MGHQKSAVDHGGASPRQSGFAYSDLGAMSAAQGQRRREDFDLARRASGWASSGAGRGCGEGSASRVARRSRCDRRLHGDFVRATKVYMMRRLRREPKVKRTGSRAG